MPANPWNIAYEAINSSSISLAFDHPQRSMRLEKEREKNYKSHAIVVAEEVFLPNILFYTRSNLFLSPRSRSLAGCQIYWLTSSTKLN